MSNDSGGYVEDPWWNHHPSSMPTFSGAGMTTQTLNLTDFLLARIAEDEAVAGDVHLRWCSTNEEANFNPCDCGWPARVLAECEAKRRIVGELRDSETSKHDPLDVAVYHLATVYADHADYREEWRP